MRNRGQALRAYEFRRRAIAVLFPNRCPFCGKVIGGRDYYCDFCCQELPFVRAAFAPPENVSDMSACCYYSRRARDAVLMLKFGGLIYPAETFALMMSERISENGWDKTADCIVPVPSGKESIAKRGFCTALIIAKRISIITGVPLSSAVCAVKGKLEQKELSAEGRRENARKSFYLSEKADVRGKHIILIDDVSTTGSTLSAIADILLKAGAFDVKAAVFAKVPDFSWERKKERIYRKIRR